MTELIEIIKDWEDDLNKMREQIISKTNRIDGVQDGVEKLEMVFDRADTVARKETLEKVVTTLRQKLDLG